VFCFLEDDGSFSFSPQTQAEMQENGFSSGALALSSRTTQRAEVEGDAALILSVSRNTFYNPPTSIPLESARTLQLTLLEHLQERMRR